MQFLLSEAEYKELVPKQDLRKLELALHEAKLKLLQQADFDCIYWMDGRNKGGYCSACPCSAANNDWKEQWNLICSEAKRYPK